MPGTAEQYLIQLQGLLPQGAAWPRGEDALLTKLLSGWADELARVDARSAELIGEADPRAAYELLTDWEQIAGLPDDCADAAETIQERRLNLVQKLTTSGGQSMAFFVAIAESLGYPGAFIEEYRPLDCNGSCDGALNPDPWRHAWRLAVPQETLIIELDCNGSCEEPLRTWGDALLECTITRLKPAHTHVLFSYGV